MNPTPTHPRPISESEPVYYSCARWPHPAIQLGCIANVSSDMHSTREAAQAVCDRLRREGFGGEGKDFPLETWVACSTDQPTAPQVVPGDEKSFWQECCDLEAKHGCIIGSRLPTPTASPSVAGREEVIVGSGLVYRNAAPGTFGPSEWLDLLMACQDGRATCLRVMEFIERETTPKRAVADGGETIKQLAEAFIRWPLPESVCADLCATKQGPDRVGTNLLSYPEALAMMRELVTPLLDRREAELVRLKELLGEAQKRFIAGDQVIDSLRAQLTALEHQNAELRGEVADLKNAGGPPFIRSEAIRNLRETVATLRQQLAEAEADKARLDWLTKDALDFEFRFMLKGSPTKNFATGCVIRGVIDAAMSAQREQSSPPAPSP